MESTKTQADIEASRSINRDASDADPASLRKYQRMTTSGVGDSRLTRFGNTLAGVLRFVTWVVAGYMGMVCGLAMFDDVGQTVLIFWFWLLLYFPAAAIHECGHYAAARGSGMRVLRMQISALDVLPQRRGFRFRWRPIPRKLTLGGYVIAFADPAKPIRGPRAAMTLGGPAANLILAGLLAAIWALLPHSHASWFGLMFASMNAGVGVANLIPHKGRMSTDGYHLMTLLTRKVAGYESPQARLIALSLFGRTADQLPEEDLSALESSEFPAPLSALWYRLKGLQNRGEWEQAAACEARLDSIVQSRDKALLAPLATTLSLMRFEIAFSQSMRDGNASALIDGLLEKEAAWSARHLWPRCLALRAALSGDAATCTQWLRVSRGYADNSIDDALPPSERMIRRSMANAFPGMWQEQ